MNTHSDFAIVAFSEHLGDNAGDLNVPWATFVGNQTTVKTFEIDGTPIGSGYMLIQALGVDAISHKVVVNGVLVSGFNLPRCDGWQTWMLVIDGQMLKQGVNTLQFARDMATTDNFVIGSVIVHWREVDV